MDDKTHNALNREAFVALVDRILSRMHEKRDAFEGHLDEALVKLLSEPDEGLFREIPTTPSSGGDSVNALEACAAALFEQRRSVEVDGEAVAWDNTPWSGD